jgi:hypothetical protein
MSLKNPSIMRVIYLYIPCLLLLSGCDPVDKKFSIKNESKNTISFLIAKDSSFNSAAVYFSNIKQDFPFIQSYKVYKVPVLSNWEYYIEKEFKDSTVNIFFIDSLSIGMDKDILSKSIKRYRVTLKEMRERNWVLTYK